MIDSIDPGREALQDLAGAQRTGAIVFDPTLLPHVDDSLFDPRCSDHGAQPVTAGGRGAAWFVNTLAGEGVLRHYRRGGMVARLSRETYLWQGAQRTRSFREFRLLQALRARGLPVPTPLAAAYWRSAGGYRAALLMLRLIGTQSMGALLDRGIVLPWQDIGRTIAGFHRVGACHADLNVDNVMMDEQGKCWLIDFDRGVMRKPTLNWQCANLARLRRSLRKRLGARVDAAEGLNGWDALLTGWNHAMREPA